MARSQRPPVTRRYSWDRIAGVVLVDAAEAHAIPPQGRRIITRMKLKEALAGSMGLVRCRYYRDDPDLTHEERLVQAHLRGRGGWALRHAYLRLREAMVHGPPPSAAGTLGTMPLTLLAATGEGTRVEHPEQDRMAALSDKSRLITVDTGHYIHWDDPELVATEVLRMVQQLRGDRGAHQALQSLFGRSEED